MAIARYTVAVNRRFKRDGEQEADFIPCVAFGKAGEFASRYFKKGMMVCVSGRIQVRSWEDDSGNRRWSTEIVLDEQDFAESKESSERGTQGQSKENEPVPQNLSSMGETINDEDLPFG